MIRYAVEDDAVRAIDLIGTVGLFTRAELPEVAAMMRAHLAVERGDDTWIVTEDDGRFVGAAYYAPERMTSGTWNLFFIGVDPDARRHGRGAALMRFVEDHVRARGGHQLLVETSATERFEATRAFYVGRGFGEEARIRDFYDVGDDKVVYRKRFS